MILITVHTPNSGRVILINVDKIESIVEVHEGERGIVSQINMDSGDQGKCRETIEEITAMLQELRA